MSDFDNDRSEMARLMYQQLMNQFRGGELGRARTSSRPSNRGARPFCGIVPQCFTLGEWSLWQQAAREANPGVIGPCADCTPYRKIAMEIAGKCERPEVKFTVDEDGFVEGYWPAKTRKHRSTQDE